MTHVIPKTVNKKNIPLPNQLSSKNHAIITTGIVISKSKNSSGTKKSFNMT